MSRTFAYTRVSTPGQTTENQVREIEQAGFDVPEYRRATEVVSGSVPAMRRPGFAKLVEKMEPGDVLVVTKFDRLGRNAMDVQATIERLAEIPVKVHCLAIQGVDLASPGGAFTMHVLNAVAQLERDLIIERTKSGTDRARAQGKRFGRPPAVPQKKHPAILKALGEGQSVTAVARRFGTSRPTINRIRDRYLKADATNEEEDGAICNLYSMTSAQAAIRDIADVMSDQTGNLAPLPAIFPDQSAPVVRVGAEGRELAMMRWGMPSPSFALKNRKTDPGVTNVRNLASAHWRRWLGPEHRCLVPFTSFSEYRVEKDKSRTPVWFAADDERPLMFFAGIWTGWTSVRKVKEGEITADLYGFLTTEANATVGAVHPKAMPVILTEPDAWETWLTAPFEEAKALQRPLPNDALMIVAEGERRDAAAPE